jgi:acyl carrier protein
MRDEQITCDIKEVIMQVTGLPESKLVGNANFIDDLGIESIDAVDIVIGIEKKYGIEIPEERFGEFDSIDAGVELIKSILDMMKK